MGLYHDFSGVLSESHGGVAVQRHQKRLKPAQRNPMPGYPMDMWGWGSGAHTQIWILPHLCPDPSPWSALELGFSLWPPAMESTWEKTPEGKPPRENSTVIQEVGDGWGTMRKAAGFCSTGMTGRRKMRTDKQQRSQGRRQQPPASLICSPSPSSASHQDIVFIFSEGKQRALRGQREKWGVSEEREHSCEKCHSYLGNWKYFPSLPEWSFPDFNYSPIVSEKDTWPVTSFGPEEIRLSTF